MPNMDQITFQIIFICMIRTAMYSGIDSTEHNNSDYQHVIGPEIPTTREAIYQDVESLNTRDSELGEDANYRITDKLECYEREHPYMFVKNQRGLTKLKLLLQIHDCTWKSDEQNISSQLKTVLSNKEEKATSNYFRNTKVAFSAFLERIRHLTKNVISTRKCITIRKGSHRTTKIYQTVTRYKTTDQYVSELKNIFNVVSSVEKKNGQKKAAQLFFKLLSEIIYVCDYANDKNVNKITMNEVYKFLSICVKLNFKIFDNTMITYKLIYHLTSLSVNSLRILCNTRRREKCLLLPEFISLCSYIQQFLSERIRSTNFNKICTIYIVSRIEMIISKMINLNEENVIPNDMRQENEMKVVMYRSFIREILLSNLLLSIQINSKHICFYILMSRFEHLYLHMRVIPYANKKVENLYNVIFLTFSTFAIQLENSKIQLASMWKAKGSRNHIYNNEMLLKLLFREPKQFKNAFKERIRMIFSSIVPGLARFEKLLNIICAQIDNLDEQNYVAMLLKANAIYSFVRDRLLVEEQYE